MDDFKNQISKDVLNALTMEDLWKSPGLKKYIEEKYPRAYITITEPMREFGLYGFIKIAIFNQYLSNDGHKNDGHILNRNVLYIFMWK